MVFFFAFFAAGFLALLAGAFFFAAGFGAVRGGCGAPAAPGPTVLIVFALGCAVLAGQSFLYAIAPACYPTAIRGMGVGAAVAIGRIGSIAGPKLAGVLKAAGHGYSQLLTDLLPIAVIASVTAVALAWYTHRANLVAES